MGKSKSKVKKKKRKMLEARQANERKFKHDRVLYANEKYSNDNAPTKTSANRKKQTW